MEKRPWGYFEVLADCPDYKVKRLVIYPGETISLQYHKFRNEHWFVVEGEGKAIIDNSEVPLSEGFSFDIPNLTQHRVENYSDNNLIIIEVQTGLVLREDDIVRVEDKYGRKTGE